MIIEEIAARGGTVAVSDHQKQLQDFPGADHWLVVDGNVTTGTRASSPRDTSSEESSPQVVIEVIVDADDADEVEQKLRADGYLTRRSS